MTEDQSKEQPLSRRTMMGWAIATLIAGTLPLISSLLVELIAPWLGCLVIEHGAYTRGPSFAEDPGDLTLGCTLGGVDIGPALHAMHLFLFAILITWPILIASLILWLKLLMRAKRRM